MSCSKKRIAKLNAEWRKQAAQAGARSTRLEIESNAPQSETHHEPHTAA